MRIPSFRTIVIVLLAGVLALSALAPLMSADAATPTSTAKRTLPSHLPLPDGFQPEGIEVGPGATAYLGSRATGDLYRLDLKTGEGEVFSDGPGTPSLGLKIDKQGRLFVSGGTGGDARVVDSQTGEVLKSYALAADPANTFVNDVTLVGRTAYFTDSRTPNLYAVTVGRDGTLPDSARTIPLGGEWVQPPAGSNGANGITATPDGKALLVVNSTAGRLFRVDPASGEATRVRVGQSLSNGDGLLTIGREVLVVRNRLNQVVTLKLNEAGTRGERVDKTTDPDFDVPTTVARRGDDLYLPNARFTTPPTPETEYWVTRVGG